jgi:molybdopterin-binding protein
MVRVADAGISNRSRGLFMKLSARNQIRARVIGVTAGEATANIELDAQGVRLVASITVEAARDLALAEGSEVIAVIKASDVIVAVAD